MDFIREYTCSPEFFPFYLVRFIVVGIVSGALCGGAVKDLGFQFLSAFPDYANDSEFKELKIEDGIILFSYCGTGTLLSLAVNNILLPALCG